MHEASNRALYCSDKRQLLNAGVDKGMIVSYIFYRRAAFQQTRANYWHVYRGQASFQYPLLHLDIRWQTAIIFSSRVISFLASLAAAK